MVSCGSKIIKILLGIFNLLWLILGAGIIFIGVKLVQLDNNFSEAADLAQINLKAASFVILAIGIVIALISFLGFCGACCENAFMLNSYGFLLILMIGAQIYAIVYAIQNNSNIETEISNAITKAITEIQRNNQTAFVLETLQYNLKCCGWANASDYQKEGGMPDDTYPGSCCGLKPVLDQPTGVCHKTTPNFVDVGCAHQLHFDEIQNLFKGTIGVGVAIILFEAILILAACCLAREVRYS